MQKTSSFITAVILSLLLASCSSELSYLDKLGLSGMVLTREVLVNGYRANLADLDLSAGSIEFDPNVTSYTVEVPANFKPLSIICCVEIIDLISHDSPDKAHFAPGLY
jgi:hypothetical protein